MENLILKLRKEFFEAIPPLEKVYRIFNKRTLVVEESMHVVFDESNSLDPKKDICSVDDDVGELVEINAQEENASKPLELEGPNC